MMLNVKLKNLDTLFEKVILDRGRRYFKDKRVKKMVSDEDGNYYFSVTGSEVYTVKINITTDGTIRSLSCSCPYDKGEHCKHKAAALFYIKSIFEKSISNVSSVSLKGLMDCYAEKNGSARDDCAVRIVPFLEQDRSYFGKNGNYLKYSLKIGRNRMYLVRDFSSLFNNFQYGYTKSYGKDLVFEHKLESIDDLSKKLIGITMSIYNSSRYRCDRREFTLTEYFLDSFFDIYKGGTVFYMNESCSVKEEDPLIGFSVKKTKTGRYLLKYTDENIEVYKGVSRLCVFWASRKTFYLCSPEYSRVMSELMLAMNKNGLFISEKDMTGFYSTVLRQISPFADINGVQILEEFVPPEMCAKLYLDYSEDMALGKLEFSYGDSIYPAFADSSDNYTRDFAGEMAAKNAVRKFFAFDPGLSEKNGGYCLYTENEDMLYNLLSEGMKELAGIMEVYATDRFDRIEIRPPFRPAVGVRPSGSMLELEITADGYTLEELADILKAYRQGKKFHRLRDGSFADIGAAAADFSEIAEGLNITDKTLKKEKLKIPAFRMLYLDSLAHSKSEVRIDRSSEFKKKVRKYKEMLSYSESIGVPPELENILREYQCFGFRWLCTIAEYGFGGILADDMGLGKTLQAAAFMLDGKLRSKSHVTSLVVCPSSVMLNWESELARFAPSLKTVVVMGTAAERAKLFDGLYECDVVITSYSLIARDFDNYGDIEFFSVILDEAQYIKNQTTQAAKAVKSINGVHRFALTGTPVENSLAELWSIFDFIMPGYLYAYSRFKSNFETPIVKNADQHTANALSKMVSPFILRRMKKDVLTELPDKTETLLFSDMESEQSKVYSANVASVISSAEDGSDSAADKIKILAMLTRLRQICCDPSLVYENYGGGSAKLEQCAELVENCVNSGHKILLFSQFTSMLSIIADRLDAMGISYYVLTGATKPRERISLVNRFNSDDTKVFLISLKAGGTGLNLTGADIVIHYDPWWNSSAENQASDRAYRIGQKKNVQIYKMIARKTIEEKIIELQQSKSELADIAVSGAEASESSILKMSVKDILGLLR